MRAPQPPRSGGASPYANRAGRSNLPLTSPGRSQRPGLTGGGAKLSAPGQGGLRPKRRRGYGPPGWYPPDWRGGILRAAPPPEAGPGSSTPAPDTGGPDDAAWQAPTPLTQVAPATGPGLFVIERRTGSQWTRAYVGMSASGVGQALRWITRAPRILGVQADLDGLRVHVAEAPFDTATPAGRETLRRWRNEVASDDNPAGNTAVSRGSAPRTRR
jgi:hypothetical protein